MTGQAMFDQDKSRLLVLLAILALSSLGFAILGLTLSPELVEEPDLWVIPGTPDLEYCAQFWAERGFYALREEPTTRVQTGSGVQQPQAWLVREETWYLVPSAFEQAIADQLWTLVNHFLEEGWSVQIEAEESGYTLGFWTNVASWEERILAQVWQVKLLTPHDYEQQVMGFIPVLGELFDPLDYQRGTPEAPILAIIIDDWGYRNNAVEPLLNYPFPLTMAILPHLPISAEVSERAASKGHEVILHQPLEALDLSLELGPGGIFMEMDPSEKVAVLTQNIASLPEITGVNNHMGSRATEDPETMEQLLQVLKEAGLFFVDSHTSSASVVAEVAQELGLAYGVNNLFIDNESDLDKIKEQIRKGLNLAKKQGHATIIGHVRPATASALWEMVPEILEQGVALVPISKILH